MSEPRPAEPAAPSHVEITTVRDLERRRWRAVVDKNLPLLQELLAEGLVYTHTSSRVDGKVSLLNAIASGEFDYQSVTRSDETAASFGDVVVLSGRADIKIAAHGVDRSLDVRYSAVWARQIVGWQFICWHSTAIPALYPADGAPRRTE